MISKLPVELQSAFRTGITITSLPQCVIELVVNSLDANASRIGVRIDLDKYNLQVVDNGCGIDKAQLELVGERYMTSKCSSLADLEGNAHYYGYRGEAVASIKDACEALVVISKPEGHSSTFSKVMKGGSDVNNRVSKAMLNRPGNGTTVAVTNLFYNLPVRRKRMYNAIELEQLRHQMQAIALIHPKVSFTLRDDVTKSVVFNTKKCSNIIENFNQISKLEFPADSFVEVTHSTHPTFKINGFVCKNTYKSKEHQYIYVNNRLVEDKKLYSYFNHKLSKSFYFYSIKMKSIGSGFSKNFNFDTFKKSPETSTGHYAIFIINIMCPYKEYDITLDPRKHLVEFKDWDEVLTCLAKSADKFVEHEKLLDNTDLSRQPVVGCENTEREHFVFRHHNSSVKKSEKLSPTAEEVGDVNFEKHKRKTRENFEINKDDKEESKSTSAKVVVATSNNDSSEVVEGCKASIQLQRQDTPDIEIVREIVNESCYYTPSPVHKLPAHKGVEKMPKVIREMQMNSIVNKNNSRSPVKKIYKGTRTTSKNEKESSKARRIPVNIITPTKNGDISPEDVTIMNIHGKDNHFKIKHCKENDNRGKESYKLLKSCGEKSCAKRPLSQGHSEHVLTQCNFDFSSKLRKRMRLGVSEASNYRTILPIVHAEIYETNLKEFKSSMTGLGGGQISRNNIKRNKIDSIKTNKVVLDPQMKSNQYKNTKASEFMLKNQDDMRQKKVVKFSDQACQGEAYSKDARITDKPREIHFNFNSEANMSENVCNGISFQSNKHHPLVKIHSKLLPIDKGNSYVIDRELEGQRLLEKRLKANRCNSEENKEIRFRHSKLSPEDVSHVIIRNSLKENTTEDLFFSNTVSRRCSVPNKSINQDHFSNSYSCTSQQNRCDYRNSECNDETCKHKCKGKASNNSPNCSNYFENSLKNMGRISDDVNTFGISIEKSTYVELPPDPSKCINSCAPGYVSNNTAHKVDIECCVKDFSCATSNQEIGKINPDIPEKNSGNSILDRIITVEKSVESCICEVNEIISFYKLKHRCCSKLTNGKPTDESKRLSTSQEDYGVGNIFSSDKSLKLNEECSKQPYCRNDKNDHFEPIFVADNVRNRNPSYKPVPSQEISSRDDDNHASFENENNKEHLFSTYSISTSNDSSITQYNNSIFNRNEDSKLFNIPPNKNSANEDRQFSFYFKPRESNTLHMFDCFNPSPESSEDGVASQKGNSIQLQSSHSLDMDNFRKECISEPSPIVGHKNDDYCYNVNKNCSGVCTVEKVFESVDALQNIKESQNENVTSLLPSRNDIFQFDEFNAKRTIRPVTSLKLENSTTLTDKLDPNDSNNFPCEKLHTSAILLNFGSRSQRSFENHDFCECSTYYEKRARKLASSAKVSIRKCTGNCNLSGDVACRSDSKTCVDHVSSLQSNSIFHESSEISSKITGESKVVDETDLKTQLNKIPRSSELKNCKEHSTQSQTLSIFHESLESSHGIIENTPENDIEDKNKLSVLKSCKTSKMYNAGELECTNYFPPTTTISILDKSTENNNEVDFTSKIGEKGIENERESKIKSCETDKTPDLNLRNDAFPTIFDVDVKYLASKEIINKAAVVEDIEHRQPGNDAVESDEKCCPESNPLIGENTNKYFANATGFTLNCNTDVVTGEDFVKILEVCDGNNEPDQMDSKTSKNDSLNSKFLNNLAEAYNFNLTPSCKSKAENMLKCDLSPKCNENVLEWVEQTLPTGLKVFIHKITGMSSYLDPYVEHPKAFNTSARNPLLPLGMSPILITPKNCSNEGLPDLTCDQKQNIVDLAKQQKISTSKEIENSLDDKGKLIDTPMMQLLNNGLRNDINQEQIGMIQLPFQIASNTSLNCMYSVKHLEDAEVIGLLDNRFIVTIINVSSTDTKKNVITLFDQHAVDERIRFERLLNDYRNDDGSFRSSDLIPPVNVTVDHNCMKVIKDFIAKFEFIGLKFSIHDDTLVVTGVPKCLLTRAEKESAIQCKELLEQGIKNLLHEQIETLLKTGGVVLSSPKTLISIIAFEACRGAIKFGDSIELATAKCLLKKLSACRAPYQCAHGRPVLAPIIHLPPSNH